MRVLAVTAMFPSEPNPACGVFVKEQIASLRNLGVDLDTFIVKGLPKAKYLQAIPRLRRAIRSQHYDLIHAHHVFCGAVAVMSSGLPVIVTFHGSEVSGNSEWSRALCRYISRRAAATIVVSSEMKKILRSGDVEVIPCGVDRRLFYPRDRNECRRLLGLSADPKLVLFTGFFDGKVRPLKRLDLAREAVSRAHQQVKDLELWVVSNVPRDQMPLYIGASDAVILTSDSEGSPMIVKEALMVRVPVVSVRVGDVPEISALTDGCFLCERNPEDLANKLVTACHVRERPIRIENLSQLSLEAVADRILTLYSRTLIPKESIA